jgi:hypothetical protein
MTAEGPQHSRLATAKRLHWDFRFSPTFKIFGSTSVKRSELLNSQVLIAEHLHCRETPHGGALVPTYVGAVDAAHAAR